MPVGGRNRRGLIYGRERPGIQHKSRRCATFRPVGSLRVMRRIAKWPVVPVLVVLLGAAGVGQADAHSGAARFCGSSDGHLVITRDVQAEVYRVHKDESEVYEYWGCVYGSRRSFRLGVEAVACDPYGCFYVAHVTLAGATVAYETALSKNAGNGEVIKSEWHVAVLDLRSGRMLHSVPTGVARPPEQGVIGAGETRRIVIKSDGAVAWIVDTTQKENRFEVHGLDATGERVLAVGSNIAPESLALAGSTLYWTQGGKPVSAVLH
jgi:hypothetical protein